VRHVTGQVLEYWCRVVKVAAKGRGVRLMFRFRVLKVHSSQFAGRVIYCSDDYYGEASCCLEDSSVLLSSRRRGDVQASLLSAAWFLQACSLSGAVCSCQLLVVFPERRAAG
jgi:hypothetical protein